APRGKGTNLAGALRYASKLLRHRAIIVVVSDFRAEAWEEALGQLAARHEVVANTIDDPREYDLPDAGWVELEDAETGKRLLVDTSHGPTRTRIRVAAERMQQERTRKLVQAGVDRVALQTTVPYGVPLRRAFADRARRLSRSSLSFSYYYRRPPRPPRPRPIGAPLLSVRRSATPSA